MKTAHRREGEIHFESALQERIDRRLTALKVQVEVAQRENKQGWTIRYDLKEIRGMVEELEELDRTNVRWRTDTK